MAWVKDPAGRYVYLSKAFLEHFGPQAVRWLGKTDAEVVSPAAAQLSRQHEQAVLAWRKPVESIELVPEPDGRARHFLVIRFAFTRARADYVGGLVVDVTAQKAQSDEWARLATIDELTGLHNRRGFLMLATHELLASRRRGTTAVLVYLDLDDLKQVNDTYGHRQGDLLLVETARLLREECRASDVVARIGGDEFTVFAADLRSEPGTLCKRLEARLGDSRGRHGLRSALSFSIGVATCAPDQAIELPELIEVADRDLYVNKRKKSAA
jgi:diguanylate cyclase (GGDEF)-like protein/PAS domain S-box-containing protein